MTPLLVPNLGAEEGPGWRRHLARPEVETAAWLWRLLFGPEVRVPDCPALAETAALPHDLDIRGPAFRWLDPVPELVPWMATAEVQAEHPEARLEADPAVVRRVHDKAFAAGVAVREGLEPRPWRGVTAVLEPEVLRDPERARTHIAAIADDWPDWARGPEAELLLKPRWGTSGRGRVRASLDPPGLEALAPQLEGLAERGGALLEPWAPPLRDFSVQLRVAPDGTLLLLGSLEQLVSPHGVVRGHRGDIDSRGRVTSASPLDESLREDAAVVAGAARDAGFAGVCGVDACTFRAGAEERAWTRPVVELNARFTVGTAAVGLARRALPGLRSALGLQPGERRAFALLPDAPPGGWSAAASRGEPSLLVPLWRRDAQRQPALLFALDPASLDRALGPFAAARAAEEAG